jgi:TonB family protein
VSLEGGKSMTRLSLTLVIAGFMLSSVSPLAAGDLKIVANRSVKSDSISSAEIKSLFLAEKNSLKDGSHVEPVFLRSGSVHETFVREFLKQSPDALQNYYGALVFTGKGAMPKSFDSELDVLAYVARTKGAIGYVSASASADGVKTLAIADEEHSYTERKLLNRIEPEYPETLQRLGIGGTVKLRVTISPKGSVENAFLLGGNPILGEAAIAAVKKWAYVPAASWTTIEIAIPFDPKR